MRSTDILSLGVSKMFL